MIVGLTGQNAAGKGSVAEILQKRGFDYHSLSDVIRDELRHRGLDESRGHLTQVGNELRSQFGASILALRILRKLDRDRNYVIDSIRNPAEVAAFRELRPDFSLVNVVADVATRFERIAARGRIGDTITLESFRAQETREWDGDDPLTQQLRATSELADEVVDNSGTFEQLEAVLQALLARLAAGDSRPDWDTYFMDIARMVATRSNCVKRSVAAVIVRDRRVVSTGYNGTPRGARNCNEGGCPRCNSFGPSGVGLSECFCSHAEENAITQAAFHGVSVRDSTIYTTFSPCMQCTKMIINAGIAEVVYNAHYPLAGRAMELLRECEVHVRQVVRADRATG